MGGTHPRNGYTIYQIIRHRVSLFRACPRRAWDQRAAASRAGLRRTRRGLWWEGAGSEVGRLIHL